MHKRKIWKKPSSWLKIMHFCWKKIWSHSETRSRVSCSSSWFWHNLINMCQCVSISRLVIGQMIKILNYDWMTLTLVSLIGSCQPMSDHSCSCHLFVSDNRLVIINQWEQSLWDNWPIKGRENGQFALYVGSVLEEIYLSFFHFYSKLDIKIQSCHE